MLCYSVLLLRTSVPHLLYDACQSICTCRGVRRRLHFLPFQQAPRILRKVHYSYRHSLDNMVHPLTSMYKELSDYSKKNEFSIEKYLEHKLVISKDAEFEMYEYEVTDKEIAALDAEEGEIYVD